MIRTKYEMEWIPRERKTDFQRPFIFSISKPKSRYSPCRLYRIGVRWEILLKNNIPVQQLNLLFTKELELIRKRHPNLSDPLIRNLKNSCNYIAPKDVWASEMQYNLDSFIRDIIPRINQLLSGNILSSWIVGQILTGILTNLVTRYEKSPAVWLASQLIDGSIVTFKNILDNSAKPYKPENFFSFIFNQYQQLFTLMNFAISVSHKLVDFQLPLSFLKNKYFLHAKNEAARNDLWNWCIKDQDFFGKEFYAYWTERGYTQLEIMDFEKTVLPHLGPSDEECEPVQSHYPMLLMMPPLSPIPLSLGTPVFLSHVIVWKSPPLTPIHLIESQYLPVNFSLPPSSINFTASMHHENKVSAYTPTSCFPDISEQLQKSMRSNLSTNRQGLLVNQLPAPKPNSLMTTTSSSTLSTRK